MNAAISAIAEAEGDASRYMPEPPVAFHDHGAGRCEEVPLVNREFLLTCGTEALYIVLQEMGVDERFAAETKEDLADLIIAKTHGNTPSKTLLPPPMIPPLPPSAREKRRMRSLHAAAKDAIKEARREQRRIQASN